MSDQANREGRATADQLDQAERFAEALHVGAYCADPSPYHADLVRALVAEVRALRETQAARANYIAVRWGPEEGQLKHLHSAGKRLNQAMRAIGLRDDD
jgi:hypothetical protein